MRYLRVFVKNKHTGKTGRVTQEVGHKIRVGKGTELLDSHYFDRVNPNWEGKHLKHYIGVSDEEYLCTNVMNPTHVIIKGYENPQDVREFDLVEEDKEETTNTLTTRTKPASLPEIILSKSTISLHFESNEAAWEYLKDVLPCNH